MQDTLSEAACSNGIYDEGKIRNEIDKVQIFDTVILIFRINGAHEERSFQNGSTCDILIIANKNGV